MLCAFDLIELNGKELRPSPIEQQKDQLRQTAALGPTRAHWHHVKACQVHGILIRSALKFQSGMVAASRVPPMKNAERTAIDMIHRYGTREAAIQQAHAYDIEAITDKERAFWRAVLAELRSYVVPKAAE